MNYELNSTYCGQALELVYKEREAQYGTPKENFDRIAKIWSAILGYEVTPEQVCLCMIGVKISRESMVHKEDNLVDICGYVELIKRIKEDK